MSRRTCSGADVSEKSHREGFHHRYRCQSENDWQESDMELAQARDVSAKMVHTTLCIQGSACNSQNFGQVGEQTALREDEERVIVNMQGDHSDNHCGFLTILDNLLTVGQSAGVKE
jgi:hypothetical protein